MGSVIAQVSGYANQNEKIGRLQLQGNKGTEKAMDLRFGHLYVLPLKDGEDAQVNISGHWKLNYGKGHFKGFSGQVKGGDIGLIIDLRGRPLRLAKNIDDQREQTENWLVKVEMGGQDHES